MVSASALGPRCDLAAFEPADDAIGGARRGQAQDRLQRCSRCRSGRDRALGAHAARRGECGRKPRRTGEHPSTDDLRPRPAGQSAQRQGRMDRQHDRVRLHPDSLRQGGGNCSYIVGAHLPTHMLTAREIGYTIRFKVVAKNSSGWGTAFSAPTPVLQRAAPPSQGTAARPGTGNPADYGHHRAGCWSTPAGRPTGRHARDIPRSSSASTSPRRAWGPAGRARPRHRHSIQPVFDPGRGSHRRGRLGDASRSSACAGFPVSRHQQLIAIFVRARKPGENLLAGISTRALVSIRVTRPA